MDQLTSTPDSKMEMEEDIVSIEENDLIQLDSNILITIDRYAIPNVLLKGLEKIVRFCPHKNVSFNSENNKEARIRNYLFEWKVEFRHETKLENGMLEVQCQKSEVDTEILIYVYYKRNTEAFKALGKLLGVAFQTRTVPSEELTYEYFDSKLNFKEKAQFETFCLMLDCSRNAVPNLSFVKSFLRYASLMGFNMLQLYTEDTYEVRDEPFFGYCRGGYTFEELQAIDNYAYDLGIEVVACIQALGHLGQVLQWPRFYPLRDTSEVLLTKSQDTYDFIEKMIINATAPLRSKKIHLGMDEAAGLGEGRYKDFFGQQAPEHIFVDHLDKVRDICKRLDLKPMIWSDMLFCIASENMSLDGYYSGVNPIQFTKKEQEGIDLIYWDYYHVDSYFYSTRLQDHSNLGCKNPWMASGAWTWTRFWCSMQFSIRSVQAAITAAKPPDGVGRFMLTVWGDDGTECDYFSSLPIMAYASLQAYTQETSIDIEFLKCYFAGICGAEFESWYKASELDELPFTESYATLDKVQVINLVCDTPMNPSKHILWEDPFYSIHSSIYSQLPLREHYENLYKELVDKAMEKSTLYPLNNRLKMPIYLAKILTLKIHLRTKLVELYKQPDKTELKNYAEEQLIKLKSSLIQLWHYHRSLWLKNYKPFGWEVLEQRYGTAIARVDTMLSRITDYCSYHLKIQNNNEMIINEDEIEECYNEEIQDVTQVNNNLIKSIQNLSLNSQAKLASVDRFAILPEHALNEDDTFNEAIIKIPELEIDIPPAYHYGPYLSLDYYRASTTSRPG